MTDQSPYIIALIKTFKNPITYIGAGLVGVLSFSTRDFHWGYLTPFIVPFIVQYMTRCLTEEENAKERRKRPRHTNLGESRSSLPIIGLTQLGTILNECKHDRRTHLLLRIKINAATEVMRLTQDDGMTAESELIHLLEERITNSFAEGRIYKTDYSSFLVIMRGNFEAIRERVSRFAVEHSPFEIRKDDVTYYPELIIGCTALTADNADDFSRLEFAAQKAALISGRSYWHIDEDDAEYLEHKRKRTGLRLMRKALGEKEIGLFSQPIVSLQGELPLPKYELLMRHYKAADDIGSPFEILETAHYNNVTQDLDLHIVELLCKNFEQLFGIGGERLEAISINISGPSFATPLFGNILNELVTKYDVPKDKLILEITEDVARTELQDAEATMENFKAFGFKLALDDIGTGSSNFQNLKNFPVDYFKIDRAYCEELLNDTATYDFVTMIINVAKDRGKMIIAEGVPDDATLEKLREMGVDYSQSYLTGMPEELVAAPKYR